MCKPTAIAGSGIGAAAAALLSSPLVGAELNFNRRGAAEPQGGPVSRHLLDTNVISNATQTVPSAALVAWMTDQRDEDLFRARLMAEGTTTDRPRNPLDMIIGALAEANDCVLVSDPLSPWQLGGENDS